MDVRSSKFRKPPRERLGTAPFPPGPPEKVPSGTISPEALLGGLSGAARRVRISRPPLTPWRFSVPVVDAPIPPRVAIVTGILVEVQASPMSMHHVLATPDSTRHPPHVRDVKVRTAYIAPFIPIRIGHPPWHLAWWVDAGWPAGHREGAISCRPPAVRGPVWLDLVRPLRWRTRQPVPTPTCRVPPEGLEEGSPSGPPSGSPAALLPAPGEASSPARR